MLFKRLVEIWSAARKRYGGGWFSLLHCVFIFLTGTCSWAFGLTFYSSFQPALHFFSSHSCRLPHSDSQGSKKPFRAANRIYTYGSSLNLAVLGLETQKWKYKVTRWRKQGTTDGIAITASISLDLETIRFTEVHLEKLFTFYGTGMWVWIFLRKKINN